MYWPPRRDDTDVTTVPVTIAPPGAACDIPGRRLLALLLTVPGQTGPVSIAMFDGKDTGGRPLGAISTDVLGNANLSLGLPGLPLETDLYLTAPAPIVGALLVGTDL